MKIYYRIEIVAGTTFSQLNSDATAKKKFVDALNSFGEIGWKAYQMEEAGGNLLVFMRLESQS